MIILRVSGEGGPILSLLSVCLVEYGRSGIGIASHLSEYARHRYSLCTAEQPRDCTTEQWLPFSGSSLPGVTQEAWVVWIDEDHVFNGLKGDMRFGLGDGMSHVIRLKPKAQMGLDIIGLSINLGLDITGMHISPPLIRARLSGMNQGIRGTKSYPRSSTGRHWAVKVPINASSKGALHLTVRSAVIII